MPKHFTPGLTETFNNNFKKLFKDEKGAIFYLNIVVIMLLMLMFAGLVEVGRVMLVREQLQTASDAAALASATASAHRFVKINVVTDRGETVVCSEDGCWCEGCGTVSINNIYGDEKTLLDEGGWRDFCVEPCDCGGGDCWYELVDREILYDTPSVDSGWRSWGVGTDINQVKTDLTNATIKAIAYRDYLYYDKIEAFFAGKSLEEIYFYLTHEDFFIIRFAKTYGNSLGISYDPNYDYYYDTDSNSVYTLSYIEYAYAKSVYDKISSSKTFVARIMDSISKLESASTRSGTQISAKYAAISNEFFEANKPSNALSSGIIKQTVYGYEKKNSPYYPSIVIYATAEIKSLFPKWFGDRFTTTTCTQATTFYKSVNAQNRDGNRHYSSLNSGDYDWIKPPEDACWVDF